MRAFAIVVLATGCWFDAAPPPRAAHRAEPHREAPGAIYGFVIDPENGEWLAHVAVVVAPIRHVTFTDAEGYYLLDDVPPGEYTVTFTYQSGVRAARHRVRVARDASTRLDPLSASRPSSSGTASRPWR
jgi:hypothetical protein